MDHQQQSAGSAHSRRFSTLTISGREQSAAFSAWALHSTPARARALGALQHQQEQPWQPMRSSESGGSTAAAAAVQHNAGVCVVIQLSGVWHAAGSVKSRRQGQLCNRQQQAIAALVDALGATGGQAVKPGHGSKAEQNVATGCAGSNDRPLKVSSRSRWHSGWCTSACCNTSWPLRARQQAA